MYEAAYSAFEGVVVENDPAELEPAGPPLADHLREAGVERVDLVGIATDHCVRMSALDAVREGFDTRVLLDLCVGVAPATTEAAVDELRAAGVEVVT
jgi:nicotinamidase/pyrazinamidase